MPNFIYANVHLRAPIAPTAGIIYTEPGSGPDGTPVIYTTIDTGLSTTIFFQGEHAADNARRLADALTTIATQLEQLTLNNQ